MVRLVEYLGWRLFPRREKARLVVIYWVIIFLKIKGRYCEPLLI